MRTTTAALVTAIAVIVLSAPCAAAGQAPARTPGPAWDRFAFVVGEWVGEEGGNPGQGTLLDAVVGCAAMPCLKSGYALALASPGATPRVTFVSSAVPQNAGQSGQRTFCSSADGVIHFDPGAGITAATTDVQCQTGFAALQ